MRALIAAAALALAACSGGTGDLPDDYGAGDDWDNPGGDWASSHFSRLTDISADNVDELGLAWEYDLGTTRVQESTPVVIDGVMYASGNLGRVYALNAATGEELWTFTPEVQMQANRAACCDQANRGVQVHDGKVFVASLDGWLYALDAKTLPSWTCKPRLAWSQQAARLACIWTSGVKVHSSSPVAASRA